MFSMVSLRPSRGEFDVELESDLVVHVGGGSTCPSLDCLSNVGGESVGVSMGSSGDHYDTDFFGGCHDFDNGNFDEEFEAPLSWRLDPSQSHSDWTIRITTQPVGCLTEYHVHKNILSVGPRKSEYFATLFRCSGQHQLAESASNTSDITLEGMAAQAFPRLLDFVYSSTNSLYVTTENAIALRFLAQYFGMRLMHKKVMEFLRQDINLSNVNTYICDSFLFQDEKISGFVADTCAANIVEISPTSPLVETVDPEFFLHVISSPEIDTCAVSGHLSNLVASYCKFHKEKLDLSMFRRLTHRNHMPLVEREASLVLLEIEADLITRECEKEEGPNEKDGNQSERKDITASCSPVSDAGRSNNNSNNGDGDALSCLQKRCIKVLALHWKEVSDRSKTEASSVFEKLPSSVVLELLDKSLSIAKQRLNEATRSAEAQRLQLEQEFDVKFTTTIERHEREHQILERVQRDASERISHLRLQLADRDRLLAEYRREMRRFCRVPPTHSFGDAKQCTYHHMSQPEPFDHDCLIGQYGRRRPTSLPRFGDRTEDGYLFVTPRGNLQERWPIYYYKDD